MAERLLRAGAKKKLGNKRVRKIADNDSIVLVGTYKDKQLNWIKKNQYYNYPIDDADKLDLALCGKIKELWLYAGAKAKRHCFKAEFVGIQTKSEFLEANPTYKKLGASRHNRYMVFKTEYLDLGDLLEGVKVFVRAKDFAGGRAKAIAKAVKQYNEGGEFGILADYLPKEISKLPKAQLRVCEAAVQLEFVLSYPASCVDDSSENQMKVISLFSGAGGLDIGFDQAGFKTSVMVEFDPACCRTLRKNMPNTPVIEGDINQISTKQILDAAGLRPLEAALVIGGPPCQSFSLAGKRMGMNDPRGMLILQFIRVVRESLPKAFVMENVRGIINWENGKAVDAIMTEAAMPISYEGKTYTYKVSYQILNAADFGAPQFRERVFVVGNREEKDFVFPSKQYGPPDNQEGLKPYKTVRDAICELPPATPPSEVAMRVSRTIKDRIAKHGY